MNSLNPIDSWKMAITNRHKRKPIIHGMGPNTSMFPKTVAQLSPILSTLTHWGIKSFIKPSSTTDPALDESSPDVNDSRERDKKEPSMADVVSSTATSLVTVFINGRPSSSVRGATVFTSIIFLAASFIYWPMWSSWTLLVLWQILVQLLHADRFLLFPPKILRYFHKFDLLWM